MERLNSKPSKNNRPITSDDAAAEKSSEGSESHSLVEELLDERFPEVLFHSFGLEHQAIVQLAQPLHEAVWRRRRPEVFTVEVLGETWRTTHTQRWAKFFHSATVLWLARKREQAA